eukprot:COSAG01_NODE_4936_length_4610_cov_4.930836_2_plen_128_part_00
MLDAAGFRLGCLRVLSMLATSEARCVALLAPPSALASVCVAVCRHKYDLEGTRCAVNILRNLALPPSCVPGLLAAGALGGGPPPPPPRMRCAGAGGDNGIDHNKNWLRFPYDSTFFSPVPFHEHCVS